MAKSILERLIALERIVKGLCCKCESTSTTYSRNVFDLPVPTLGDVLNININAIDTIIAFQGDTVGNFTLNAIVSPTTQKGDRIYLMVKGIATIFVGPNLNPTRCGTVQAVITPIITPTVTMTIYEMIYDGTHFTGIDNC